MDWLDEIIGIRGQECMEIVRGYSILYHPDDLLLRHVDTGEEH